MAEKKPATQVTGVEILWERLGIQAAQAAKRSADAQLCEFGLAVRVLQAAFGSVDAAALLEAHALALRGGKMLSERTLRERLALLRTPVPFGKEEDDVAVTDGA
jgi:hypothetical protein